MRKFLISAFMVLAFVTSAFALQKNVASQKWTVFAFDRTDNTPKTGDAANITGDAIADGSSNTIDDTNPTELGNGYYIFDLAQAETNGNYICMNAVSSTSDIQVVGVPGCIWTMPPNMPVLSVDSNGRLDVAKLAGTAINTDSAQIGVNVVNWKGTAVAAPATAGIPDVNTKNINNVATTSVTTVSAYQGTTQPINFTGTGATAYVKNDTTDWKGSTAPAMTGDAYARLGAPAGASVSADVAAIKSDTGAILTDTAAMDTANELRTLLTGGTSALSTLTAANIWETNISAYSGAGYAGTYLKNLYDNQGNWLTATGFSTHSAADVVTAMQAVAADFKADVSGLASQSSVDDIPTNSELAAAFTEIKGATWSSSTDTLEAIRDRGDAAWITATGFSTFNPASDYVLGDLRKINNTAIVGTGTQVAAGFEYFFNVATPGKTMNDVGVSGSGLSAQDVRDAMKLAPSAGAAASGSIDDQLATAQADLDNPSQYKATGFSTHSAADVWAVATRVLTANTNLDIPAISDIVDGVWDALKTDHDTPGSMGFYIDAFPR